MRQVFDVLNSLCFSIKLLVLKFVVFYALKKSKFKAAMSKFPDTKNSLIYFLFFIFLKQSCNKNPSSSPHIVHLCDIQGGFVQQPG